MIRKAHQGARVRICIAIVGALVLTSDGLGQAVKEQRRNDDALSDKATAQIKKLSGAIKWDWVEPFTGEPSFIYVRKITGDGAETVLADLGGLGAYTDAVLVFRVVNDVASYAKFRDRKGRVNEGGNFVVGASVRNSANVIFSASQQTIYFIRRRGIDEDAGTAETCEVEVFEWRAKPRMFVERRSRKDDEVRCQ